MKKIIILSFILFAGCSSKDLKRVPNSERYDNEEVLCKDVTKENHPDLYDSCNQFDADSSLSIVSIRRLSNADIAKHKVTTLLPLIKGGVDVCKYIPKKKYRKDNKQCRRNFKRSSKECPSCSRGEIEKSTVQDLNNNTIFIGILRGMIEDKIIERTDYLDCDIQRGVSITCPEGTYIIEN